MPRYFIKRLTVEGFRGINNEGDPLDLKFKPGKVNSVFAQNGIGKSSLFEALYFAIHGTVPKLSALQTQEKPDDYYSNRFHSSGVASILLEFEADDGSNDVSIQIERDASGSRNLTSPSGHADPAAFLANLKEAFALLDYRTFARFIDESPLERGRTFSALLGLAEYSDCRQALQAVSDSRALNSDLEIKLLTAAVKSAQGTVQQSLTALRLSYERVTGQPLDDVDKLDDCAAEIASALASVELLKPHLNGKGLEEIDFEEVKAAIKDAEGGEQRRALEIMIQNTASLEALAVHDQTEIESEITSLKGLIFERDSLLALTRGDLFKKLYESAKNVTASAAWEDDKQCPLCESDLSYSLSTHIEGQLAQYRDTAAKITEIHEIWQASTWRKSLEAHEATAAMALDRQARKLSGVDSKTATGALTKEDFEALESWTHEINAIAAKNMASSKTQKEEIEKELPQSLVQLTEQVEYGRQFKEALELLRNSQAIESEEQSRLDVRERWRSFITKATGVFSKSETALSKARISGIDSEYKSMFREIMRLGDVVPELKRADEKEHLDVRLSNFHGQHRLSARALLSESYRNALAISVFLAAALKHSGTPRFVVLDDVTSSFDAGHQYWLMELIRTRLQQPNNADGLQFIILSHDGLLEKYFDRLGGTNQWHHTKLQGSPPMGAILHQAQGADRLKFRITSLLAAGQITQAEPLLRQYLEYKLQQIIRKVDIPVPIDFAIKDSSRMVSNCLDAITQAVDLHQNAGSLALDAQQVQDLSTAHVPAIVGNWTSHYETGSGSSLSAPAIGGVVTTIDDLAECFRYDDTSETPPVRKWYRSLSRR